MNFSDSVKIAVHEVRANAGRSREIIHEGIDWLNRKGAGMAKPRYWGK